jgi:hypothetical protein
MSIIECGTDDYVRAKDRNRASSDALLALLIEHHGDLEQVAPVVDLVPEPISEFAESAPPLPSPHGGHRTAFQKWIDSFEPLPEPNYPTVHRIKKCVSEHFGISVIEIDSPRRTAKVVQPRQIAMYLAKQLTPRSFPDIGRKFGMRDHTTVLHAVRKIAHLVHTDANIAGIVSKLTAEVKA